MLEDLPAKIIIFTLTLITVFLTAISSAWDFPYGQDAIVNFAQITKLDLFSRPVHGTMNILGVIFYIITDFFGGSIYHSFNFLNIVCSVVFVISIYLIFLNRTESNTIAFLSSLSLFVMPNIWLMMTMHAYYSSAFAFLSLSVLFYLKGTVKYLVLSGICLGFSLMSNPAVIFVTPLYLLIDYGVSKRTFKRAALTIGISMALLSVWIALTFNNYFLSGPWNVIQVVSENLTLWSNPVNAVLMLIYTFVLNYNFFMPFILFGCLIIYRKERTIVVIAAITLLLNYFFWYRNYGRYLMPYIILTTIIFLGHCIYCLPGKKKFVSLVLMLYIIANSIIGIFGYSVASKNNSKEYLVMLNYVISHNIDKKPEIIGWDNCYGFVQYFHPGLKSINLDRYRGKWEALINKLEEGRTYFYLPQADLPVKTVIKNFIPQGILDLADKIPKEHMSIFYDYDKNRELKIQILDHDGFNYYLITKVVKPK